MISPHFVVFKFKKLTWCVAGCFDLSLPTIALLLPWSQRFFLIFHRMRELREGREAALSRDEKSGNNLLDQGTLLQWF